jgi:hypothetical protein
MYKKIPFQDVKKFIENEGYKLLTNEDVYQNTLTTLDIECKNEDCRYIFHTSFCNFKHNKSRCPKCSGNLKLLFEQVKEFIKNQGDILLSKELDYKNIKTKLKIECGECTNIYYPTFSNYKYLNRRCKKCHIKKRAEKRKYSFEFVKNYIEKDNKYLLISKSYTNTKTKIEIKCLKCNKNFLMSFSVFKNDGCGCPKCNQSHGESKIEHYLLQNNIKFVPQYKTETCKNKRCLPFDFYLPEINKMIEFDGGQHFKANKFFGEKSFEKTQFHDNIKTKYCYNNAIFLLRIAYTEINNIGYWLDKFLDENFGIKGENLILVTDEEKYKYLDLYNM